MNNNISRREARGVVELGIMVDWYNYVTPFAKKGKEWPPPPPPEPWRYRRPECCQAMNVIILTSWRRSTVTMKIGALTGSTLLSLWSFQAFIFSFLPYFFHSETVALRACPYQASEYLSYKQASSQKMSTVPPDPWSWIAKIRPYPITLSNASHQPVFARCTWFEVCHTNNPYPIQPPPQIIDGLLR